MDKPKYRKGLIKKGTPHPLKRKYKYVDSHLTKKDAVEEADMMVVRGKDSIVQPIPRQYLVYSKPSPITPKRRKLSR